MMKRSMFGCLLLAMILGLPVTPFLYAQEKQSTTENKPTTEKKPTPKEQSLNKNLPGNITPVITEDIIDLYKQHRLRQLKGEKRRIHPRFKRQTQWIIRLRTHIYEKMKLTTEQLNYIDAIIGNHMKLVNKIMRGTNLSSQRKSTEKFVDNQPSESKSSSSAPVDPAKKKFLRSANDSKIETLLDHMGELTEDLKTGFPKEHLKEFEELIILWDLTHHGALPDGPLRRWNRIVKSPVLKITRKRRDSLQELIATGMKTLGPQRKQDKNLQQKIYSQVKKDIYKILTPEEKIAVDKAYKFIVDDARDWEERNSEPTVISSPAYEQ